MTLNIYLLYQISPHQTHIYIYKIIWLQPLNTHLVPPEKDFVGREDLSWSCMMAGAEELNFKGNTTLVLFWSTVCDLNCRWVKFTVVQWMSPRLQMNGYLLKTFKKKICRLRAYGRNKMVCGPLQLLNISACRSGLQTITWLRTIA